MRPSPSAATRPSWRGAITSAIRTVRAGPILFATALAGLAGTGATYAALSDRIASLTASEERVAPWHVLHFTREVGRFAFASELAARQDSDDEEAARLRFEIMVSRFAIMEEGYGDQLSTNGEAAQRAVAEIRRLLGAMETAMAASVDRRSNLEERIRGLVRALEAQASDLMRMSLEQSIARRLALVDRLNALQLALTANALVIALAALIFVGDRAIQVRRLKASESRFAEQNRQLAAARAAAEGANSAKSLFLSHMAHELRTPLNAILGFSEILARSLFGPHAEPRYQRYAQDIYDSGQHLLGVVNRVLDLAKIESGRMALAEAPVDLAAVARQAVGMVSAAAARGQVALSFSADESARPFVVRGDAQALAEIAVNLLSNAVKFTPAGGSVTASVTEAPDGRLRLAVADTGIGIAPEAMERIFEPFMQASAEVRQRYGGTGLGLPIVKRLAELLGGEIGVSSAPGAGTRFTVDLPRVQFGLGAPASPS